MVLTHGIWSAMMSSPTWWRHQMEPFSALLALCVGNSPVPGEFPTQRPVTRSFGVFFDLRPNRRLSKQWWGWWFETSSRPLWRHRNVMKTIFLKLWIKIILKIKYIYIHTVIMQVYSTNFVWSMRKWQKICISRYLDNSKICLRTKIIHSAMCWNDTFFVNLCYQLSWRCRSRKVR